ncbi:unnamed protein product [Psylliodes chrysocephalus]|uniref:Uncharacterized protein n=1 Tax=Psylliodes chrysocephalus TaxID=3402493 RepID=A0A9P0CYG7_9CUCU|nr:unnamed protein product [Psylliodes chrysocephala]
MNVCKICFQEVGRGKVQPCGSASVARDNCQKLMVNNVPYKQQKQVASDNINWKIESTGANSRTNVDLELSTLGSKSRITINPASSSQLLLLINGQQTVTSSHPCPFCFFSLKTLRNCQQLDDKQHNSDWDEQDSDAEIDNSDQFLRLKTYGNLKRDYSRFLSAGNTKKFAEEYHSTINAPLLSENDDRLVIEKCVITELFLERISVSAWKREGTRLGTKSPSDFQKLPWGSV